MNSVVWPKRPGLSAMCAAAFILVVAVALASCGGRNATGAAAAVTGETLQDRRDALQAARPDVAGFALALVLPDGTMLSAATGVADPDGRAMTAGVPVRIASITKTVVAAAVLRLWEEGRLDLDAPVSGLISAAHDRTLRADGYDTDAIAVRHLLMHAGGLNDHFATDAFKDMALREPRRVWTRAEQVRVMTDTTDPVAAPGARFSYSDTGYLLLGDVIERIADEPLGQAVRKLTKFDEIGLDAVWWDAAETPAPSAPARAHQWLGDIDTHGLHGSVDAYGGGGLVASVEDVARFFAALFGGAVFDKPETLSLMMAAPGRPEGSPYRIGLFAEALHGYETYRHGGFWGTDALALPDAGLFVAGVALNQSGVRDLRALEADLAAMALGVSDEVDAGE